MANDGEPLLPQELLDSIVDKLRPIDDSASHQALQSCALVCNSFRLRAHRALFFRINLVPETLPELQDADSIRKQRKRTQELYRLLKANPYLISCIRSLKINIDRRAKVTGPLGYLAEVLDILYESTSESQGLVELIVRSGTPSSVPALWPNISAPTQKSLLNLIHGPKTQLKRLILGNFKKLPLTMFVRCQILKSLILEWVEIDGSPEDNTSNRTVQDDLWSLGELVWTGSWSLNNFFQGLATIVSIKTLASKLRRLCVSGPVPVQDGMILRKILEWSADSLRSLILDVRPALVNEPSQFPGALDISPCRVLFLLELRCNIRHSPLERMPLMSSILEVLIHSASMRPLPLRYIFIPMTLHIPAARDTENLPHKIFGSHNRYDELDKLLTGPSFTSLREVVFRLKIRLETQLVEDNPNITQGIDQEAANFFKESFPALHSSKIIVFKPSFIWTAVSFT